MLSRRRGGHYIINNNGFWQVGGKYGTSGKDVKIGGYYIKVLKIKYNQEGLLCQTI